MVNMEQPIHVLYPSAYSKRQVLYKTKKHFGLPWYKNLFSDAFRFENAMIVVTDYQILFYFNKDGIPSIRKYLENIFNGKYLGVEYTNPLTFGLDNVEEILI